MEDPPLSRARLHSATSRLGQLGQPWQHRGNLGNWKVSSTGCWDTCCGSCHRTILKELNKRRVRWVFCWQRKVGTKPKLTYLSLKTFWNGLCPTSESPLEEELL